MTQERRRYAQHLALAAALTLLAGCAPAGEADDSSGTKAAEQSAATTAPLSSTGGGATDITVDLAIRDFSLRALDTPCSGARPYLDLHPSTSFQVLDGTGQAVATGEFPQGVTIKATDLDYGNAPREPSFCVFSLDLPELPAGAYDLVAGDDRKIPFTVLEAVLEPIPVSYPPIAPGGSDPFGRDTTAPPAKESR